MKAIILAAGYATRLYPLTKNFPKPLLEVGGKTILDHLVDQLETIPEIDGGVLVTNHRFRDHFRGWAEGRKAPVEVLDDGTASNEDRLGAVGDFRFALRAREISEDVLVCAADNILRFPLADLAEAFRRNPVSHICVRPIEDPEDRRRRGIAVLAEDGRVLEFCEKPAQPKSHWGAPPLYLYPAAVLPKVGEYLDGAGNPDAPGHFVEWLCRVVPVYAYRIQGSVLDIGNPESLAEARAVLEADQP